MKKNTKLFALAALLFSFIFIISACSSSSSLSEEIDSTNKPEGTYIEGIISINHDFSSSTTTTETSSVSSLSNSSGINNVNTESQSENEMIIHLNSGLSKSEAIDKVEEMGYRALDFMPELDAILVEVPDNGARVSAMSSAESSSDIRSSQPNHIFTTQDYVIPNDDNFSRQWAASAIKLPQAWRQTTGSDRVRVAVLDTGIDYNHPELADFIDKDSSYNFIDNNSDAMDYNNHGTHVAGIISAKGDNGNGTAGVMWESELMAVKVLGDDGNGSEWSLAQGILYAAGLLDNQPRQTADIINLSLGMSDPNHVPKTLERAIERAAAEGIIIVAASGNNGSRGVIYPAAFPEVIAVGALEENGSDMPGVASYSNYGPEIDVTAPGSLIYSTLVDDKFGYMSGTSMAAPHVSGLAGLMLSEGIRARDVRSLLQDTAIKLGNDDYSESYGYGMINSYKSVYQANKINIILGNENGDGYDIISKTKVDLNQSKFIIEDVPSGEYEVIAWIDIRDNGKLENGDYFASTGKVNIESDDYLFEFVLEEYYK
ncbi:peptidase S8 [Halanaerobiaceae bacterium Z-7014]|uniref:Peptidase S8 n=1 Tax=Halonatronomonas betaini TaxID=2778430 RepID=A0A931AX89_9FIRM|nr:S8 family peptidase [Halonatronomonas betaini]MBF8437731.1 peptidase S8 [Halonatronomonas betaini]